MRQPGEAFDLWRDLKKALTTEPMSLALPGYHLISLYEGLLNFMGDFNDEWFAFDVESNQADWQRSAALLFGFARRGEDAYIITDDLLYDDPRAIGFLNAFFERNHFIGHNVKFDLHFAHKLGITKAHAELDTMLAHYTLDERKGTHGLKKLLREYFDIRDYDHELVHRYLKSRADDWSKVPQESLAQYLAWDLAGTAELMASLEAELRQDGLWEHPFLFPIMEYSPMVTDMEELGMMIDVPWMETFKAELEVELEGRAQELREMSGHPELNPNSVPQLQKIIWDERHLTPPATNKYDKIKGQININPRSTSVIALNHYAIYDDGEVAGYRDEFLQLLFNYRRVAKILGTYVNPFLEERDENDRYHDDIRIHGTETGRWATFLHDIPRASSDRYGLRLRQGFRAAPGYMFARVDFSQAELRAAGAISEDPFIIETYRAGRDLHTEVNNAVFGTKEEIGERKWKELRYLVKRLNFAFLYGGGPAAMVSEANIPKNIRKEFKEKYEARMKGLLAWKAKTFGTLSRVGYIETPFGRRRRFPYINAINRKDAEKSSINVPIQSTATELANITALKLWKMGYRIMLTSHDEVILEVPVEEAERHVKLVVDTMEQTGTEYFPIIPWVAEGELHERWAPLESESD
jgi:DNA polymerase-1